MKDAKKILNGVLIGNIVLSVFAVLAGAIGCAFAFWGKGVLSGNIDSMVEESVDSLTRLLSSLGVFAGVISGVFATALGMLIILGAFIFLILHIVPVFVLVGAKTGAVNCYESNAEKSRRKLKAAGIVSLVMNSITVAFSFMLALAELTFLYMWMVIYVILIATIVMSSLLVMAASKDRFYVAGSDKCEQKRHEPVRNSREDNPFSQVTTIKASEHSAVFERETAERAERRAKESAEADEVVVKENEKSADAEKAKKSVDAESIEKSAEAEKAEKSTNANESNKVGDKATANKGEKKSKNKKKK